MHCMVQPAQGTLSNHIIPFPVKSTPIELPVWEQRRKPAQDSSQHREECNQGHQLLQDLALHSLSTAVGPCLRVQGPKAPPLGLRVPLTSAQRTLPLQNVLKNNPDSFSKCLAMPGVRQMETQRATIEFYYGTRLQAEPSTEIT